MQQKKSEKSRADWVDTKDYDFLTIIGEGMKIQLNQVHSDESN